VTETAVGVAEGGDRVADRSGVSAQEEALEATTVEHAGVGGEEPGGSVDVGTRHRSHGSIGLNSKIPKLAPGFSSRSAHSRMLNPAM
jgi:hypothetical protein